MSMRQDVIDQFACEFYADKEWRERWATVCERAGYKCEYCDKDMLASLDDYLSMEADHITHQSAGGCDTVDNIALSCSVCNGKKLKDKWNPAEKAEEDASRDPRSLIPAVRRYLKKKRGCKYEEFSRYIQIVGYPSSHQQCGCCE